MTLIRALLVAVLVVLAASATASAQDSTVPVDNARAPAPEGRWYGWETGLSDVATLALIAGARFADPNDQGPLTMIGIANYLLLPPSIHLAHGQVGRGFGRLALRIGAPILGIAAGLLIGGAACPAPAEKDEYTHMFVYPCPEGVALVGALAGMTAASLVDFVASRDALSRVDGTTSAVTTRRDPDQNVAWMPVVAPQRAGATFGVLGRF